jgi:pentose-5-phosphate-3-epimerase
MLLCSTSRDNELDCVDVLAVEPGFGGQSFQHHVLQKVTDVRAICPHIDIQVSEQRAIATHIQQHCERKYC